jgi:hypothetical protein
MVKGLICKKLCTLYRGMCHFGTNQPMVTLRRIFLAKIDSFVQLPIRYLRTILSWKWNILVSMTNKMVGYCNND